MNISTSQISADLVVQVVSTGLRDIIVPVRSLEILAAVRPDMKKVKDISQKYNSVGYHVFSPQSLHGANAYCRNFAPLYGIPEESATGTSNGHLVVICTTMEKLTRSKLHTLFLNKVIL